MAEVRPFCSRQDFALKAQKSSSAVILKPATLFFPRDRPHGTVSLLWSTKAASRMTSWLTAAIRSRRNADFRKATY
jgi:hypothetical protein